MATKDLLTTCMSALNTSMLSVGSGDGSQQEAIVRQGLKNLKVTFYDSKQTLLRKYPHAEKTLKYLESNCTYAPSYQVDATQLDKQFKKLSFDLVFFTFPHTGIPNGDRECIKSNQELLKRFMTSASQILKPGGEIQITLKNGEHYGKWDICNLLHHHASVKLQSKHKFDAAMFPGYKHRLTKGTAGSLKVVPDKQGALVHVFCKDGVGNSPSALDQGMLLTIVEPSHKVQLRDEEVYAHVVTYLGQPQQQPANVLEIRRGQYDVSPPDTRQLNRVMYTMEASGVVERHEPGPDNKKPRWALVASPK